MLLKYTQREHIALNIFIFSLMNCSKRRSNFVIQILVFSNPDYLAIKSFSLTITTIKLNLILATLPLNFNGFVYLCTKCTHSILTSENVLTNLLCRLYIEII